MFCLFFFLSHSVSLAAVIRGSGPLIMTCPLASYSEVPQTACGRKGGERKKKKKAEKSIGFHYLVGQCHWSVNDPVTAEVQGWHRPTLNRCWQEENMLTGTRNKLEHRFALQAAVRGGIVRGHHAARGELSRGGMEGGGWKVEGFWCGVVVKVGGFPVSLLLLSDCLALYHKRFYPPINYSPLDTPKETRLHWLWLRGNS